MVCLESPHANTKAHVITGVVSRTHEALAPGNSPASNMSLPATATESLIHGDGPAMTVENWVGVNGDIGEGQRLWAWVY